MHSCQRIVRLAGWLLISSSAYAYQSCSNSLRGELAHVFSRPAIIKQLIKTRKPKKRKKNCYQIPAGNFHHTKRGNGTTNQLPKTKPSTNSHI